ncbi:MAG: DUF1849 family protein [Rhodospirillales bacterium]|jgi:hypothetical protein|nr:DUF1849 family protein [Rhodospirillales bacterium]
MKKTTATVASLLVFLAGQVWADTVVLQPHRAVYEAKLHNMRAAGNVATVDGTMIISLEKACDGWIFAQQLSLDIGLSNGVAVRQEVRFAGWEALDGKSYRFASRQSTGERQSGFKGSARLSDDGKPGRADFAAPETKTVELPAGTVFPVTHTMKLIEAARAGRRMEPRIVFEGSTVDGPQQVTAFIGQTQLPGPDSQTALGPLAMRPGWPVRMAVFPLGGQNAEPDFEIEVLQLDNGIVRRMVLDLGEFSLLLELKVVKAIEGSTC